MCISIHEPKIGRYINCKRTTFFSYIKDLF